MIPFYVRLNKDEGSFKSDISYIVLKIDVEKAEYYQETKKNGQVYDNLMYDDDDEEFFDEEIEKQALKEALQIHVVTYFLIADKKTGKFLWIDSESVKYVGVKKNASSSKQ